MHKFPKWIHIINDTVIPVLGYLFIVIGILQWGTHLIPIGIGLLVVYWLSQVASWLGYLNRRIDKYFAPNIELDRQKLLLIKDIIISAYKAMNENDKPVQEKPKEKIDSIDTIQAIKEIQKKR